MKVFLAPSPYMRYICSYTNDEPNSPSISNDEPLSPPHGDGDRPSRRHQRQPAEDHSHGIQHAAAIRLPAGHPPGGRAGLLD